MDVEAYLESYWQERRDSMRAFLLDAGRPDLLIEYERKMRDIDLGIVGAKS